MIKLTGLNGETTRIRACLIREMRSSPDTILLLLNGNCHIVKESIDEVLDLIFHNPKSLDQRGTEMAF
jgi:uncharacterized protein YlzI (FlbEa/FlbD family)